MFLDWLASKVMSRVKISSSSLVERKYKFPRTRHYLSIIVWQVDVYLGRLWEEGPRKWGKMSLLIVFNEMCTFGIEQIIHGFKSLVKPRKFPFVAVIKLHSNNSSVKPIKTLRFETLWLWVSSCILCVLRPGHCWLSLGFTNTNKHNPMFTWKLPVYRIILREN